MEERDRLRFELGVLLASGRELSTHLQSEALDPRCVNERYQVWYTQALRMVARVLPERRREFEGYYRDDHDGRHESATICAILGSLRGPRATGEKRDALAGLFDPGLEQATFLHLLGMQVAILASAVPTLLPQVRLPDRELQAARSLLSAGHRRAAGALAGVVLERHLSRVAQRHDLSLSERESASLALLDRALREAGVYGAARSRQIERLAKLRDACLGPKKKVSPQLVSKLLSGAEETLQHVS